MAREAGRGCGGTVPLALVPLARLLEIEAGAKPNATEAWTIPGSLQIPEEQLFA